MAQNQTPWRPSVRVYRGGSAVTLTLEVAIDWDKVAQHLGKAAEKNSTRKTGLLAGAITARIVGESMS